MKPFHLRLRKLVPALPLLVFVFAACGKKDAPGGPASSAPAGSAPPPAQLAAVVLKHGSSTTGISTTGTVLAEREVEIKTEIPGKVTRIGFREGEKARAGQVLVQLDDAELRAQAERAAARFSLAQLQEKRLKEQIEAQAVSQREYDQARADLQTAQAEADLAKAQLDKTKIQAPFAGWVGLREVELGSVAQAGSRVTTLQDLSALRVEFSVPEQQAAAVREGMKIRFVASGSPDTETAVVYAIEPRIDADTRLLRVRARCQHTRGRILPGAYVQVNLSLASESVLWVPAQSVVQSAGGSMVWVVRGGKAALNPFTPGIRTAENVAADRGLSAGDTVLTSGLMQVRPGTPVIPVITP